MKKIYVGNLPYSFSKDDLNETFAEFGEISDVHLPTDRQTGRPRGFAFVTFTTPESAQKALELNGQSVGGRNIRIDVATERSSS